MAKWEHSKPIAKRLEGKGKLLSHAETRELIAKAQSGDIKARNRILEHNGGLINRYANLYKVRKTILDFDDLFHEGMIGMIRAIELFDLSKNYRFSTYALWWIKQRIYRAMDANSEGVHIPYHIHEKTKRIRKKIEAKKQLTEKEKIVWADFENAKTYSLDAPLKKDGDRTAHDVVHLPTGESQELVRHDLDTLIHKVKTNARDKEIFTRRSRGELLKKIGDSYSISKERVRQIEKKFRRKIDLLLDKSA